MSFLRNLYARSEQWRLEWGCRTGISAAVVSFLYLYPATKNVLTRYGVVSTSFAAVVAIFVKDQTLGQTLTNGWLSILGSFIGSFLACIMFRIYRQFYDDHVPLALLLVTEFFFSFLLQYAEMVPVVKKFSICLFALNLIGNRNVADPDFKIWGLWMAVVIGSGCAIVGCIIPLPIRLAGTELKERLHYYSDSLASTVEDVTVSWMRTYKNNLRNQSKRTAKQRKTSDSSEQNGVDRGSPDRPVRKPAWSRGESGGEPNIAYKLYTPATSDKPLPGTENKHWRKLRLLLCTVAAFRQHGSAGKNAQAHNRRDFNNRAIRTELVNYLHECLPYLQARFTEAKFGPSRRMALRCTKYIKLIQDILLIVGRLENHVENMEKMTKYHYVYGTFFARPNLQYGIARYAECLKESILSLSRVLQAQSSFDNDVFLSNKETLGAIQAAARLLRARSYFDSEYLKARRDIFYPERGNGDLPSAPEPTTPSGRSRAGTALSAGTSSPRRTRRTSDAPTTTATAATTTAAATASAPAARATRTLHMVGLKAYGKAMLDVNSAIFLLDTLSRLLLEFWPVNELTDMINADNLPFLHADESKKAPLSPAAARTMTASAADPADVEMDVIVPGDSQAFTEEPESGSAAVLAKKTTLQKFWIGLWKFMDENLPTKQSHLLCFSLEDKWTFKLKWTEQLKQRLVSSLVVAVAITVAGFYGIINRRPSPALASLTIAFLTGGAVSGINVMTCINRAAGTAVACVYSVMVAYIISTWSSETAKDFFVGAAIVLMQIPACYVRSYPLYSYSGTVTGFTTSMLLLTSNATTSFAVNRIIDTYVAVTIYLVLEFCVSARFTEDEIFADMRHVFEGIEEKFTNFHRNFHFFKAAEDSCEQVRSRLRGGTLSQMEVAVELQRIEQLREDIRVRKDLEVESIQEVIRRQQTLTPFYRSEPAVFRPAVFPANLLQDTIALEQQAVNSIQVMIWAVKACDGTFDGKIERLIVKVHRKVQRLTAPQHLEGDLQDSARSALSGDRDVERPALYCEESERSSPASSEATGLLAPLAHPSHMHENSLSRHATARAISVLPEFKTLLLPLEPHFIEVQKFVSAVLVFLSAAMDRIVDWQPTLRAFYSLPKDAKLLGQLLAAGERCRRQCAERSSRYTEQCCKCTSKQKATSDTAPTKASCPDSALPAVQRATTVLGKLSAVTQHRHSAQLSSITAEYPHLVYERLTYGKDDIFDTEQMDQLYLNYQALIEGLQKKLTSDVRDTPAVSDTLDGDEEEGTDTRRIPSNREIVIVNTFLASTQQLIAALHGLTVMVGRLQAHRDIRVTQDGKSV